MRIWICFRFIPSPFHVWKWLTVVIAAAEMNNKKQRSVLYDTLAAWPMSISSIPLVRMAFVHHTWSPVHSFCVLGVSCRPFLSASSSHESESRYSRVMSPAGWRTSAIVSTFGNTDELIPRRVFSSSSHSPSSPSSPFPWWWPPPLRLRVSVIALNQSVWPSA